MIFQEKKLRDANPGEWFVFGHKVGAWLGAVTANGADVYCVRKTGGPEVYRVGKSYVEFNRDPESDKKLYQSEFTHRKGEL